MHLRSTDYVWKPETFLKIYINSVFIIKQTPNWKMRSNIYNNNLLVHWKIFITRNTNILWNKIINKWYNYKPTPEIIILKVIITLFIQVRFYEIVCTVYWLIRLLTSVMETWTLLIIIYCLILLLCNKCGITIITNWYYVRTLKKRKQP